MHDHPIFKHVSGYSQPVVTMGQEVGLFYAPPLRLFYELLAFQWTLKLLQYSEWLFYADS